jgi:hypothetical protein
MQLVMDCTYAGDQPRRGAAGADGGCQPTGHAVITS